MAVTAALRRLSHYIRFLNWAHSQRTRKQTRISVPFFQENVNRITPEDFLGAQEPIVMDARSISSFEASHYPGSSCIPLDTILDEALVRFPDTSRTIYVFAATSHHSHVACHLLKSLGYTHVIDMGEYKA